MSLSSEEKGDLIFKEIRNSYTFWQIKKSLKDEMIKPSGKAAKQLSNVVQTQDIEEAIPKLLNELNLETKIKNKVHEILDRNGFFNETSTITQVKFKQCTNPEKLPGSFSNVENEPLECVAQSKAQWSEHLK